MWLISEVKSKVQNVHSNYENSNRNISLDILKGIAIFCVVWGHFIQQGTLCDIAYKENPIFQLIYSFHMPLFMLISGYLMYQSINKRTVIQQWVHWCKNLILPLITWTFIANIFIIVYAYITTNSIPPVGLTNAYQYWFIISLLLCGFITTVIKRICNDKTWIYLILTLVLFTTTFNLFSIGWMFPFFTAGYLLNKHSTKIQIHFKKLAFISIIVFPALLMFYNDTSITYISIFNTGGFLTRGEYLMNMGVWIEAIPHNLYKVLTGFAGCGFMYGIVKTMQKLNLHTLTAILAWFGTYSLVIYFIQRIIIEILFGRYLFASNIWVYDFIFTLVLAIISTLIFAWFGTCIKKNKILNTILCGGR